MGTEYETQNPKLSPQGWVWLPSQRYARNLFVAGESFDWREFKVHIYRQGIKPSTKHVTLYIERTSIDQGELAIDEVSLHSVKPIEYQKSPPQKVKLALQPKAPTQPRGKPTTPEKKPSSEMIIKKPSSPTAQQTAGIGPIELLLLDRGDTKERWSLNLGSEFPGAAGELNVEEVAGGGVLKVGFDLSGGGRYVGAQCSIEIRKADALVFDLFAADKRYFTARITDATGQMHSGGFLSTGDRWETINLPLNKDEFHSHWGGANDGTIHFPLSRLLIAVSSTKGEHGEFRLRDLAVNTRDQSKTWRIGINTNQPGQIHFADDSDVRVTVMLDNLLRKERSTPLMIEVFDLDHHRIAFRKVEKHFAAWQSQTIDLLVKKPGPGYYSILVTMADGTGEGSFGVVRKPSKFRQRDVDSFFAMHVSDPEIAARIGVHFTRYFHYWQYTESQQGKYEYANDYIDACLAAGIDVMMCLDYREPGWLKTPTRENGLPTDEALRHYAEWIQDAVSSHPKVAVFEIQNEPDFELARTRNLPSQIGVEFYSQLVEIAAPIIRREAPHAPIAGCSVSGGDYNDGFTFSRSVFERVGRHIDIFAAHPYASPRTFGPGLHPSWAADNHETEKHQAALDLLSEFEHTRRMWIGEKGWEISAISPLASDVSLSFAHCQAQSLIIARSNPGIEKYFWFMQRQKNGITGKDYTLFRGDETSQPMPSAVAYANVAWHLDSTEPIASLQMADDTIQVHVFQGAEAGRSVAAIWSAGKPFVLNANLPDSAVAFDLFGRNIPTQGIKLTVEPIFIQASGTGAKALLACIKDADLAAGVPFEVVSASLSHVNTLRLGLVNRTPSTLPVWCRVGDQKKRIIIPALAEPTWTEISLADPMDQRGKEPLHVDLSTSQIDPVRIEVNTDVLPVASRKQIIIDGQDNDWEGVPVIVTDRREHIQPPDPVGWRGPQDLSCKTSLVWDDDNLYLLVRVTDDKHVVVENSDFRLSDSLQIAIDTRNDARARIGFDKNDREYAVLLDANGTRIFQTHPSSANASFRAVVKRTGTETSYEMAVPWSSLGLEPQPGMVFSLNFIANENDGSGRKCWMGMTPGIGEGKRPIIYQDFYLKSE